ncbi:MAG: alkaline phosphatase family protein [Candidatus Coatesbacteria bacterium]|nr:MAG: alkaline phosphatase family protein [Candidatus Coatesbacteria bacterium]
MSRLLILGLDGFGYDFAARLFASGRMPFLANRAAAGAFGPAASPLPPVSTAAWTTISTGAGIGRHGIVDFRRRELAEYAFVAPGRLVNSGDVRLPRLYDLASAAGLRVFVLNLPVTYPAAAVNGILVTGLLTPPGGDRACWPPEFRKYLAEYVFDLEDPIPSDLPGLCRRLEELAAGRLRVATEAFRRERFDLGLVVFTGPDRLFHRFYEEAYAAPEPASPAAAYLAALDRACEGVYEAFGADAALLVCSDHGFGPGPRRAFYVNRLLKRAGFLTSASAGGPYALHVVLEGFKKLLGRGRPLPVDWARTAAYGLPLYMRWGGLVVNASGEQRAGIVSSAEITSLRDDLAELLRGSAEAAPAAIQWAKTREELYSGPATTDLPHVVFEAGPEVVVSEAKGPGPVVGPYANPQKRGEHTPQALALAAGLGVVPEALAGAALEDVAATAAKWLGFGAPAAEGKPWI